MRGACDGLNLVCPANDPHLITSRPIELRVAESGDKAGLSLATPATPGIDWRLHPAAPELAELYKSKTLAFVHAAGHPRAEPQPFRRQRYHGSRRGQQRRAGAYGERLAWALSRASPSSRKRLARGFGFRALAGEFKGFASAFSVPDLANGLPLPWDEKAASAIEGLYSRAPGAAGAPGLRALEAAKLIAGKLPRGADGKFTPYLEQKEAYDKAGDVGRGLRTVARLIKAGVGLTVASVDAGVTAVIARQEHRALPFSLSLSQWERGRLHNGCDGTPSPIGRGLG